MIRVMSNREMDTLTRELGARVRSFTVNENAMNRKTSQRTIIELAHVAQERASLP